VKIRLMGTEAECARLTFLLRFGPPGLDVLEVSGPRPNQGDSKQVRVYLEVRLHDVTPLVDRTFYSLVDQEGRSVLTDAWGNVIQEDGTTAAVEPEPGDAEPGSLTQRPAEPGELCTCGRQAVVVYLGGEYGPTGDCGIRDGGARSGPCPFCGGPRHGELEGRCPPYRLRLTATPGEKG
jgi:hypothetical protein